MGTCISFPSLAIGVALLAACGGGGDPSIVEATAPVHISALASKSTPGGYASTVLGLGGTDGVGRFNKPGEVAGTATLAGNVHFHAFFFDGTTLIDLGAGEGRDSTTAALNDRGQVVGYETLDQKLAQGFSWTPSDGKVILPVLPGTIDAIPTDVNNAGEVVGIDFMGTTGRRSFYWTESTFRDIGTLGGPVADAIAINDAGQVVGTSFLSTPLPPPPFPPPEPTYHGFMWSVSGGMVDLGTLGGRNSMATYTNASGQVVGTAWTTNFGVFSQAFSWTSTGGMTAIGAFGGGYSTPLQLTERGQVVGYSSFTPNLAEQHAFSWTPADGLVDLGTLSGGHISLAIAANASGLIIGNSDTGIQSVYGSWHAVVWPPSGGIVDLGTFGGPTSMATSANDAGEVVGTADVAPSEAHAFVWTERSGLVDLNDVTPDKPPGTVLREALEIHESGAIIVRSSTGPMLLRPTTVGFVTGGGWIDSPPGADFGQPGVSGRAHWGFEARIPDGATKPEGQLRFDLRATGLSFRADAWSWMRISGDEVRLAGTGSLNGVGGYSFVLTAVDGALSGAGKSDDRFRLRISHATTTGEVVDYDNGLETLGGGNIVIHRS
jgi:probable HAF family extracellular repeat protein